MISKKQILLITIMSTLSCSSAPVDCCSCFSGLLEIIHGIAELPKLRSEINQLKETIANQEKAIANQESRMNQLEKPIANQKIIEDLIKKEGEDLIKDIGQIVCTDPFFNSGNLSTQSEDCKALLTTEEIEDCKALLAIDKILKKVDADKMFPDFTHFTFIINHFIDELIKGVSIERLISKCIANYDENKFSDFKRRTHNLITNINQVPEKSLENTISYLLPLMESMLFMLIHRQIKNIEHRGIVFNLSFLLIIRAAQNHFSEFRTPAPLYSKLIDMILSNRLFWPMIKHTQTNDDECESRELSALFVYHFHNTKAKEYRDSIVSDIRSEIDAEIERGGVKQYIGSVVFRICSEIDAKMKRADVEREGFEPSIQ